MIIFTAASQSQTETLQLVTSYTPEGAGQETPTSISNINTVTEGSLDSSWHRQLLLKVENELPLKGE